MAVMTICRTRQNWTDATPYINNILPLTDVSAENTVNQGEQVTANEFCKRPFIFRLYFPLIND